MRALKLSITIATVALTSGICQAQPGAKHPRKHIKGIHHRGNEHLRKKDKGAIMAKELGLSPKQTVQLKAILKKQRTENKVIHEKMVSLRNQISTLKERNEALNELNSREIEALLTPEQLIQFEALKKYQKEN